MIYNTKITKKVDIDLISLIKFLKKNFSNDKLSTRMLT